jgi:hypothetical protein
MQLNIIGFAELLINYHFLKFVNFFNLLRCFIHVIYIVEQCLYIILAHFITKFLHWCICISEYKSTKYAAPSAHTFANNLSL